MPPRSFHVIIKPIGPKCNLECSYCFYLQKGQYYPETKGFRMSLEVLESFVRQYIEAQDAPEVIFAWQGGEPTLMGLDFFRAAVELQRKYLPPGMLLINAFQTNGTLLDNEWCRFLKAHNFLVGLSLDGPGELHDRYRRDKSGGPTFQKVVHGLELLQRHAVETNVLCVVHRHNSRRPEDVYRFFKEQGVQFLQFIPLVERLKPPGEFIPDPLAGRHVSEASVGAEDYGQFLCAVYDQWIHHDVGKIYVQMFDAAFASHLGVPSGLCVFEPTCGRAMALEHNGDLYSCDHYVDPQHKLGNILESPLVELAEQPFQKTFGEHKRDALPPTCSECSVLSYCRGECPKNRFAFTSHGHPGLNYLCQGLKMFFEHAAPTLAWMGRAYRSGRAPAEIMTELRLRDIKTIRFEDYRPQRPNTTQPVKKAGRNDSCPCGSGAKYKRCCGR